VDTFRGHLELAALGDLDRLGRAVARLGFGLLDLLDDVVALKDLAEYDVSAIEPTAAAMLGMTIHNEVLYGLLTR
jgi:hypothetical protein